MSTTILALMFMAFAGDSPASAVVLAPGAKLEKLWGEGSSPRGAPWPPTARSCSPTSATGSCGSTRRRGRHGLPRAERPGQRPDLRPEGPAGRRRGGEHRRRPTGLDHRGRRHRPHPGRPLRGQAVQQPERRGRRRPGASTSPTPATSATSPASSTRRRLPDRPRRVGPPPRDHGDEAQRPGGQPRRQDPLRRRQRPGPPRPAGARPGADGAVSGPGSSRTSATAGASTA